MRCPRNSKGAKGAYIVKDELRKVMMTQVMQGFLDRYSTFMLSEIRSHYSVLSLEGLQSSLCFKMITLASIFSMDLKRQR